MAKLYIVGFGPGDAGSMTAACRDCLQEVDIIVGYSGYIRLLRPLFPEQNFYESGMTEEEARCRKALQLVAAGQTVAVVSSGDSGVYGMASLLFELAAELPELEIEVIPGVTAALSGAALLGAPLGHDFVVISLSDLLTPWQVIEKRLRAAAAGDFVICLYNPGSQERAQHLQAACAVLRETIPEHRLCGLARNIGRAEQAVVLTTLGQLSAGQAGMQETVFIGNSQTKQINGRLVTPRGYLHD